MAASCTPCDRSSTSSFEGKRVVERRRRRSWNASSANSTRKGRIAVVSRVVLMPVPPLENDPAAPVYHEGASGSQPGDGRGNHHLGETCRGDGEGSAAGKGQGRGAIGPEGEAEAGSLEHLRSRAPRLRAWEADRQGCTCDQEPGSRRSDS